jgi:2-methylisocitrate lyase-like PEP mutase family enzyme
VSNQSERVAEFRKLHEASHPLLLPNPWNIGTTRLLTQLGFQALATTSAGFAFDQGRPDQKGQISQAEALEHIAEIVECSDLPVNADFESGYGLSADDVFKSVKLCVATGIAGLSIEDRPDEPERLLYPLEEAVDRVRAARSAIDESGSGVLLTARAECFLVGSANPLSDVLTRLAAYAQAGADVLYAPGLTTREEIVAVVRAAGDTPVNVLAPPVRNMTLAELGDMGVRRVSIGSGLARIAWGSTIRAAHELLDGSFGCMDEAASFAELDCLFSRS